MSGPGNPVSSPKSIRSETRTTGKQGESKADSRWTGAFPLSPAQWRLWFLEQTHRGSSVFNIPARMHFLGVLDFLALEYALRQVIMRHDALRTAFRKRDGSPFAVLLDGHGEGLLAVDLSGLPEARAIELADALGNEEARARMDLEDGHLLRTTALLTSSREGRLLFTMHHIVSDAWSFYVFINELAGYYSSFKNRIAPGFKLPLQFREYASKGSGEIADPEFENGIRFWLDSLSEASSELTLDTLRPRNNRAGRDGSKFGFALPAGIIEGILTACPIHRATPFMILFSAFQVLLFRITGENRITVGTTVANRDGVEEEGCIGPFVNTLAIAEAFSTGTTFRDFLVNARKRLIDSLRYQSVPFGTLVERLRSSGSVGDNQLFQVMMDMRKAPEFLPGMIGLETFPMDMGNTGASQFDLALSIEQAGKNFTGEWEYSTELFTLASVERMSRQYVSLLDSLVRFPDRPLAAHSLLEPQDLAYLLRLAGGPRPPRSASDLPSRFSLQAGLRPDSVALSCGASQLTYAALERLSDALGTDLLHQGLAPEGLVGLFCGRDLGFAISVLGVWKAGGAYVPLDPSHPRRRQVEVLAQGRPRLLLTDRVLRANLDELLLELSPAERPQVVVLEDVLENAAQGAAQRPFFPPLEGYRLAYVIFTSGSTGAPKGAMVEQEGMLNHLDAKIESLELDASDCVIQNASPCFDISVWQYWAALLSGGRVEILPEQTARFGRQVLDRAEAVSATVLELVPSQLGSLRAETDAGRAMPWGLAGMRWLLMTGEALPPSLCRWWFERYAGIPLMNAYGPTECSDDVSHHVLACAPEEGWSRVPIGQAIAHTELYVTEAGSHGSALCSPGGVGELTVAGLGVGRGYLGSASRTAEVFVPAAHGRTVGIGGSRQYRTGDRCRYQGGTLEFLGRMDQQVKVRGYRIELGEIEAKLMEHAGVREAAVSLRTSGSGEGELVGYVVDAMAEAPSWEELQGHLKGRLPEYMVPRRWMRLESLPLNANGKVDRERLPPWEAEARAAGPGPGWETGTEAERLIAGVWSDLLGRPSVGLDDNFFDIGGHSLLAVQVHSRLEGLFARPLEIIDLFEHTTVRALARFISQDKMVDSLRDEAQRRAALARNRKSDRRSRVRDAMDSERLDK